jgi:hypothetical protein
VVPEAVPEVVQLAARVLRSPKAAVLALLAVRVSLVVVVVQWPVVVVVPADLVAQLISAQSRAVMVA